MSNFPDKIVSAPPTELVETCPLCKHTEGEFLFWNYDRYYRLPGKFGIVRCNNCDLIRLSPRPVINEIGFYYPSSEYYSFQTPGEIQNRGKLNGIKSVLRQTVLQRDFDYPSSGRAIAPKLIRPIVSYLFFGLGSYGLRHRLPKFIRGGKALDIGCGSGTYLNILKLNGWEVAGVDLSKDAADAAKKAFGIDVFVGPLESSPFENGTFDYIHMSHSIEHVPDPVVTLNTAYRLLKPGGRMYIETPNARSEGFRKFQKYWMPLESPRHLFLFSAKSLRIATENAGLKVERIITTYKDFSKMSERFRSMAFDGEVSVSSETSSLDDGTPPIAKRVLSRIKNFRKDLLGDFLHCWVSK